MRGRTATAAALAMALLLAVGGAWLYVVLRANLLDNTTSRTEVAARKVAAQADTGALPGLLSSPADGVDLVLVLDASGRVVATSLRTADPLAAELSGFRPSPGQDSADRIITGAPAAAAGGNRADVVVVRATPPGGGGQQRYVYAVTVLSDVDDATHAIGVALLASAPPLIALAAAIAWAVTGLALRPVTAIRRELAAVSASELDRRVPDPAGGDEIALMARTVNATLDRLEQAVTRQRQFVADASHELRNPIAAVRSRLEVALADSGAEGVTGPAVSLDGSVRAALRDTERLQRIAADLLLLARLDAHAPQAAEPVDLALLAAEEAARRPARGGPRLAVEAGEPVPVRGDPAQLERLLTNLVDNALRYAASEVRVTARSPGREHGGAGARAVLEVVDDGPGIPEAHREQVFERFARLDAARDRETGGTGLGLAIARGIARAHGGELTVRGRADGRPGARFVAVLPVQATPYGHRIHRS
ncbi:HAMP domain-containing sensor histidine kinase [Streptomyces sp. NPDC052496]|uniref:sensor histidine kinase n=1 Tax=Streptomyces sp. NPDC052496 TaxID=3154951 RepID=UPI0034398B22